MKKIILSALLCMCVLPTISAVENPKLLTSGTLKIPLINFYPDTDQLFYTESIRPLEPYRIFKLWDHNVKIRAIRQTIYNITHAKMLKESAFKYPETIKYLCPPIFLENLTTTGKNVYLSVLADYATRLTGKVDYQSQRAYAHEKIPPQVRSDLWHILAQHLVFTPEFAQEKDSSIISKLLDQTLFSVLCYDREEAELISLQGKQIKTGPLKIYWEKTLLTRPTNLDLLAQTLYILTPEAPTWMVAQAETAIGLKRFFEGEELPATEQVAPENEEPVIEEQVRETEEAIAALVESVKNIPEIPEVLQTESSLDLFTEPTEEVIEQPEKEHVPIQEEQEEKVEPQLAAL